MYKDRNLKLTFTIILRSETDKIINKLGFFDKQLDLK